MTHLKIVGSVEEIETFMDVVKCSRRIVVVNKKPCFHRSSMKRWYGGYEQNLDVTVLTQEELQERYG